MFQAALDVVDRLLQLLDRPAFPCAAHVGDLRQDVDAITGQVVGQAVHLPGQTPAGETEDREHQRHGGEDGRDAADPALEPADRRRQDEREQNGERDRHQDGLRQVQDHDDQHVPGERDPRFQGLRRVTH